MAYAASLQSSNCHPGGLVAELEDLVEQVEDASVRRQLAAAVRDLKRHRRFGLVFEEHIPELAILSGLRIEPDALVHVRTQTELKLHRVILVEDDKALLEPLDGGDQTRHALRDLQVAKRFGDPIFPSLVPLGAVRRSENKPFHAVVEGENFHTLQLLLHLYEGQVDCIYIDPPYNTGERDWKYNNRYVDKRDAWRHSKWLSFMEKRLRLAIRLLRPDGVLIVTADEHEVHHLGMLLELPGLFPEYLRYMVTIVTNPKGNFKDNFARVEEYAFFCCPPVGHDVVLGAPIDYLPDADEIDLNPNELVQDEVEAVVGTEMPELAAAGDGDEIYEWQHARRRGNNSMRSDRKNLFYPIFIDEQKKIVVRTGPTIPLDQSPDFSHQDGLRPIWPLDSQGKERTWRFSSATMQAEVDAGNIRLGKYNSRLDSWTINVKRPKKLFKKVKTVWRHKSHDAGTHGTSLLEKLLGQPRMFPFPKSLYAVRDTLATVCAERPNALIIDFFAGSGTTFHATALLNAMDGGQRRCVLVTNNEVEDETAGLLREQGHSPGDSEWEAEGIFEKVTRPRCTAAIEGRRADGSPIEGFYLGLDRPMSEGFEENVEFYKLKYLDPDSIDLGHQFEAILPLLWLHSGGIGDRPLAYEGDMLIREGAPFAVLFDEGKAGDFAKRVEGRPDITHVFLVTDSPEAYAEMRGLFAAGRRTTMLYGDYLRNFMLNSRVTAPR